MSPGSRVLVTGGAGFIGVNLGRLLVARGFTTRCFDNFTTGHLSDAEAAGYTEIVEGDILNAEALAKAAEGCDYMVHLAAQAGVPTSVADPVHDCETNVRGTLHALMAARDADVQGFVLASSSAPLGDIVPPAHEGMVARPKSPYGASKLAGEAYCSAFAGSYGVPTIALRFTNVYGPYSYGKGSVVAAFCRNAANGVPLVIYGDGSQTRDFIFVEDLARGILAAMTSGAKGEVCHLGSGTETTVKDVADAIVRRFGGRTSVDYHEERAGDILHSSADLTHARELLDFKPEIGLDEGLDRTVAWFTESRA